VQRPNRHDDEKHGLSSFSQFLESTFTEQHSALPCIAVLVKPGMVATS
jgi:hypothetical protein